MLRNPRWARPFEVFAGLMGVPGTRDADPSVVVAILAPLMFGYMFGDVVQGAGRRARRLRAAQPPARAAAAGAGRPRRDRVRLRVRQRVRARGPGARAVGAAAGAAAAGAGHGARASAPWCSRSACCSNALQYFWRGELLRGGSRPTAGMLVAYLGLVGAAIDARALCGCCRSASPGRWQAPALVTPAGPLRRRWARPRARSSSACCSSASTRCRSCASAHSRWRTRDCARPSSAWPRPRDPATGRC